MRSGKRLKREKIRKGVYILPNLFTSMNLFCGFYAVVAAINGRFTAAAHSIILAAVFDLLDGKIARATHTTSRFGMEYDSLADLISFGLAPGLMIFLWALQPMGRIGWLAAFLFLACGALRLARFNTQAGTISSDHFVGLPIPSAAAMCAVTVLICDRFALDAASIPPVLILVELYVLAFLMVSTIRFNSFKKAELFKAMNFNVLVLAILVLMFIAYQPAIALFLIFSIYVISGPVLTLRHHHMSRDEDSETQHVEEV